VLLLDLARLRVDHPEGGRARCREYRRGRWSCRCGGTHDRAHDGRLGLLDEQLLRLLYLLG
jgi:hypothetical protein